MAVAVVVDVQSGLSGFPESVMREGLKSLRMNLPESERPEVIIVCDTLAIGSSIKIPGVRTVGIAAQENDEPVLPLSIPCVAGMPDLLRIAHSADFLIVDADNGIVCVEPDVQTVIDYQAALSPEPASRIFLESSHLPARTADGRTISVRAVVSSLDDAETAISQGADALVVRLMEMIETGDGAGDDGEAEVELIEMLGAMAAGKRLVVLISDPSENLLQLARRLADNGGLTFVDPADAPNVMSLDDVSASVCDGYDKVTVRPGDASAAKDIIRGVSLEEVD